MQRLTVGRMARLLPDGWELWLDGGHNEAAAAALANVLGGWTDRPVYLVAGMLRTRDPEPYLAALAPFVQKACTVAVPDEDASLTAAELAVASQRVGIETRPAANVAEAIGLLASGSAGRILICGSLYLAGSVLADA